MKNFKKLITVLLSTLMLVTIITGCGKKVAPPEDFAKAFCNLIVSGDTESLVSLGISEDEANTLKTEYEKEVKNTIKNNLKSGGLQCTDDQVTRLYNAQMSANKKVTCTVETKTSDAKTAAVKITTNHINITEIDTKAANDAIKEIQNMNISDTKAALDKALELYIAKFIDSCDKIEASSDTVENTFAFKKVTDDKKRTSWVPDNPVTFGNQIGTMVTR